MLEKLMRIALVILAIFQGLGLVMLASQHIIHLLKEQEFPKAMYLLGSMSIFLSWLMAILIILVFKRKFKINI